jgi:hypothetical protein
MRASRPSAMSKDLVPELQHKITIIHYVIRKNAQGLITTALSRLILTDILPIVIPLLSAVRKRMK